MPILSKPSTAARAALMYITAGSLIDVRVALRAVHDADFLATGGDNVHTSRAVVEPSIF